MLLLGRKLLLALAISFISSTSVWQPGIISMVFAMSVVAVWRTKPSIYRIDMVLELASTVLLWVTYSVASSTNYAYSLQHAQDTDANVEPWLSVFAWLLTAVVGLLLATLTVLSLKDDVMEYLPLVGSSIVSWIRSSKQWIKRQAEQWQTRWQFWLATTAAIVALVVLGLELVGILYWIVHERLVVFVVIAVELVIVVMFIVLY